MKSTLIRNVCALALSLSFLNACSNGSLSDNSSDLFKTSATGCEIPGESYGIIGGNVLSSATPLSESTVLIIRIHDEQTSICTGTLIAEDKVLTAAHCTSRSPLDTLLIAFSNNLPCAAKTQAKTVLPVIRKEIHPFYDYSKKGPQTATNDLAILKFEGSLPADYKVRALPTASYNPAVASEFVMSGYGKTDEAADDSGTLRFTTATPSRLKKTFFLKIVNQEFRIDKTFVVDQPTNGVCSGDSGGPLYAKDANGLTLIGVTSMVADVNAQKAEGVRACHGISLFVDLRAHLDWIERSMIELNK